MGTHRHTWIATKKKENASGEKRKALQQLFPHYKDDEIEVMMNIVTQKEINEYRKNLGEDVK
jgi:hypothetical protein